MLKSMATWVVILIVILVGIMFFVVTRPYSTRSVWYDSLPAFYDRLPTVIRDGTGWSGRGIHRGEREIEMLPR